MAFKAGEGHVDLTLKDKNVTVTAARLKKVLDGVKSSAIKAANSIRNILLAGTAAAVGLLRLFTKQQDAEEGLRSALDNNGYAAEDYLGKLKKVSSQIQKQTIYGDEFTMGLTKQALNLGVSADKLEGAAKAAIGLGKAMEETPDAAMRDFVLATQGEFTMLQRRIPALRAATTAEEKFAIVLQYAAKGYKQAQDATKTFTGRLEQLKNRLGDIGERFGEALLPVVNKLMDRLSDFAAYLESLSQKDIQDIIDKIIYWAKALGMVWVGLKHLIIPNHH
ncbi:MAG TPA: hypothetical protein PLP05_12735 [Sedimentisphaerales bacterium]|nr:hypothetical protein [Sedimentisphaerales bacterium]